MTVRDTRMIQKAMEQRWPIRPEYRDALIKRLLRILADPQSSPREATSAAKALMAAERQNQEDEHKVIDVELQRRDNELSQIAIELGIDPRLIVDESRESDKSFEDA